MLIISLNASSDTFLEFVSHFLLAHNHLKQTNFVCLRCHQCHDGIGRQPAKWHLTMDFSKAIQYLPTATFQERFSWLFYRDPYEWFIIIPV